VLPVAVPDPAAIQPDADGARVEGPLVLDELRLEVGGRQDHAQILVRLRVVWLVPQEEGVAVDSRVALQGNVGPGLHVGAWLGILRGARRRRGHKSKQSGDDEPGEETREPKSAAAQPALSFAGGARSASPRAARRRGSTRGTARGS